ncbi:PorV/PorQ family protein [Candidatus Neomarinimicrobiota bacterium]
MKMRKSNIFKVLTVVLVLASLVMAQGARNGTEGASQLLIPQGARYLSGGGAAATAVGIEASYWNPAGLSRMSENATVIFSNRSYIAGIDVNYFGAAIQAGKFGTVALTGRTLDVGDINVTDVFSPDGTGEVITPSFFVMGATYSKQLSERTGMGISFNYISEDISRVGATGFTVDVGVQYQNLLELEGFDVGVALRNFGNPMTYGGSALWVNAEDPNGDRQLDWYKVEAMSFDMPFVMDIAASYNFLGFDLGVTYEVNHFSQDHVKILGSYAFEDIAAVRFGYLMDAETIEDNEDTDIDEASLENIFADVSFGATLGLERFTGLNLSIDYAMFMTSYFDNNHVIQLRLGF